MRLAALWGAVFFNDTATTEIYTLSLHDALPISTEFVQDIIKTIVLYSPVRGLATVRSEEHTSELQSPSFTSYAVFCLKKPRSNTVIESAGFGFTVVASGTAHART